MTSRQRSTFPTLGQASRHTSVADESWIRGTGVKLIQGGSSSTGKSPPDLHHAKNC